MCNINSEYNKCIVIEKKKEVLYVQVLRSINGCIEAALLWYIYYKEILGDMDFVVNPYDRCVANKEINGSQYTITWYVNDNKISHKDDKVLEDII